MSVNNFQITGAIEKIDESPIDSSLKLIELRNQDLVFPIHINSVLVHNYKVSDNVFIQGHITLLEDTLVVLGDHINLNTPANDLCEPDNLFEAPLLDSHSFNRQEDTEPLPAEAFSAADMENTEQGIIILGNSDTLDLSDSASYQKLMPNNQVENLDLQAMWAVSSKELMIDVLKGGLTQEEAKAKIWIALAKEIQNHNVFNLTDLLNQIKKISEFHAISYRLFNREHIYFLELPITTSLNEHYTLKFISPIFNSTPVPVFDWTDFTNTYNPNSVDFVNLQKKRKQLEELFDSTMNPYEVMRKNLDASINQLALDSTNLKIKALTDSIG